MKRNHGNRETHVLAYGLNFDQWFNWRVDLKGGLQSMHMGWTLTTFHAVDAGSAVAYIEAHKDLEIICFDNQTGLSHEHLAEEAFVIAEALSRHEHKPWVVLSPELFHLKIFFEAEGIEVKDYLLEHVATDRWVSQIPQEANV